MLDTDDMIKISRAAVLGAPCPMQGQEAEAYYKHMVEFAAKAKAEGKEVDIPDEFPDLSEPD